MAKVCYLTGKKRTSGNSVSHSHIKTKRTWGANLQKKTVEVNGKKVTAYFSTRALKTLRKQSAK